MSDALDIAKYVYPQRPWRESFRELAVYWLNEETDISTAWSTTSWYDVHDAEREILARGLGEEYGEALLAELALAPGGVLHARDAASLAAASLDLRSRALAAVVRRKLEADAAVQRAPDSTSPGHSSRPSA